MQELTQEQIETQEVLLQGVFQLVCDVISNAGGEEPEWDIAVVGPIADCVVQQITTITDLTEMQIYPYLASEEEADFCPDCNGEGKQKSENGTYKYTCASCQGERFSLSSLHNNPAFKNDSENREPSENGHGFHTPRGDWPDRPELIDDEPTNWQE